MDITWIFNISNDWQHIILQSNKRVNVFFDVSWINVGGIAWIIAKLAGIGVELVDLGEGMEYTQLEWIWDDIMCAGRDAGAGAAEGIQVTLKLVLLDVLIAVLVDAACSDWNYVVI